MEMRIAELSTRSGVTIPTIKYYLREGLLPPGEPAGRNQAAYGERHLHRLRLIRALREVGGLSVAATGALLRDLDSAVDDPHQIMGGAHRAVIPPASGEVADPQWAAARARAGSWVREQGWCVDDRTPALDRLADVIATMHRLGDTTLLEHLPRYAEAALTVAEPEVAAAADRADPAAMAAAVVTGTVLGEALLSAVRLLAHEHVSASRPARAV
jgi:DNA-binding transcriptional MerR regulator